jgi:hypothetical protein
MLKHKLFIGISALALILCVLLFLSWVALSEKKFDAYDPESYSPEGLKAVDLLLIKAGYNVTVVDKLPDNHKNLLIVMTTYLSTRRRQQLLNWVKSGGTIIELNAGASSIQAFKHHLSFLNAKTNRIYYPNLWISTSAGKLSYHLSQRQVMVSKDPDQGYFGLGHRYFIYRQSFGAGNIISWNDIGGLTNRFLKRFPDNGVIFALIVRENSPGAGIDFYNLAFKVEHSQAARQSEFVFNHYWIGGLLLFLFIVLVIWKLAARFGRPRPLILARGRSYDEFVYSLAGLFAQAKIGRFVLDNLWRDLLKIMADLTHLPMDSSPEQLILAMNRLTGKEYGPLLELYSSFSEPGTSAYSKLSSKQFLTIASTLDDYRKEFHTWKKSSPFVAK